MADAITTVLARRVAYQFAKAALRSGSTTELKAALSSLPTNGMKASFYRSKIEEALASSDSSCKKIHSSKGQGAACVADGVGYEFVVSEFAEVSFFRAVRAGSIVRVTINSAHPFGKQILDSERLSDPMLMALLASWAHYELDQTSTKRQAAAGDARADWGRVLRRLVSSSQGFSDNGSSQ